MPTSPPQLTYIGGPTLLIEFAGLRLLTDPTFDPAGQDYPTPVYTLHKLQGPAVAVEKLGRIDVVLLSHDHHFDNLDNRGRELLARAGRVLTTVAGAERLNSAAGVAKNAQGLAPWESIELHGDGTALKITATPARHGPEGGDRGPCVGFVLTAADDPDHSIYVSGDTVWFEGVAEVARRFAISTAVLFMGAAKVAVAGPAHLTFTAEEGVEVARAFAKATIVPVHFKGWGHFTEAKGEIERVFEAAGLAGRVKWLKGGEGTVVG